MERHARLTLALGLALLLQGSASAGAILTIDDTGETIPPPVFSGFTSASYSITTGIPSVIDPSDPGELVVFTGFFQATAPPTAPTTIYLAWLEPDHLGVVSDLMTLTFVPFVGLPGVNTLLTFTLLSNDAPDSTIPIGAYVTTEPLGFVDVAAFLRSLGAPVPDGVEIFVASAVPERSSLALMSIGLPLAGLFVRRCTSHRAARGPR